MNQSIQKLNAEHNPTLNLCLEALNIIFVCTVRLNVRFCAVVKKNVRLEKVLWYGDIMVGRSTANLSVW